jgi:aryl-alcohol dehydrogenase-like predicted oxidoreductase
MEYRTFRGTGAKISRLCLGTMTFGAQVDEATSIRMIHRSLEAGINFVDTADVYNQGVTETIVGKALKDRREGVVLVSKVRGQIGSYALKDQGLTRWHILHGVEASLKRLQTEALDVLLLHAPDDHTPLEEALSACDMLVRQGKIMYYGLSNHAAWQVCRAQWLAERYHFQAPVITQVPYNLIARGIEQEFLPFCRALEVGVMVYNPLAGGLLSGKHDPAQAPAEGTRFQFNQDYYHRYWRDANFAAAAELLEIARKTGKTLVQLALQWLAAQEAVDTIILGASKPEQLEENLASAEGTVDQDTLAACDRVWQKIKGPSFQYNR